MGGIFHLGTGLPYYSKLFFSRAPGSLPFPPRFIGRPPAGGERCLPRLNDQRTSGGGGVVMVLER
jgi:hypothetical protein